MNIHEFERIIVEENKITEYLLNTHHPDGVTKARFFIEHGYRFDKPEEVSQMLLEHLSAFDPVKTKETDFGRK